MPKRIDLTGQRFGRLTVVCEAGRDDRQQVVWKCVCDCGAETYSTTGTLRRGNKKSCGCEQGGFRDHTGERFGMLTAIRCIGRGDDRNPIWLCRCDCGNLHQASARNLVHGRVKSCGCLKHTGTRTTHGESHTRLYHVWSNMLRRCYNPNTTGWERYGGRGIRVCDEWHDYTTFRDWAVENGYDGNADYGECTIDRIDVNGDYEPDNCRWADLRTQGNNTRYNRVITVDGVSMSLAEWSRKSGISQSTIRSRLKSGWSPERAVTEEVHR